MNHKATSNPNTTPKVNLGILQEVKTRLKERCRVKRREGSWDRGSDGIMLDILWGRSNKRLSRGQPWGNSRVFNLNLWVKAICLDTRLRFLLRFLLILLGSNVFWFTLFFSVIISRVVAIVTILHRRTVCCRDGVVLVLSPPSLKIARCSDGVHQLCQVFVLDALHVGNGTRTMLCQSDKMYSRGGDLLFETSPVSVLAVGGDKLAQLLQLRELVSCERGGSSLALGELSHHALLAQAGEQLAYREHVSHLGKLLSGLFLLFSLRLLLPILGVVRSELGKLSRQLAREVQGANHLVVLGNGSLLVFIQLFSPSLILAVPVQLALPLFQVADFLLDDGESLGDHVVLRHACGHDLGLVGRLHGLGRGAEHGHRHCLSQPPPGSTLQLSDTHQTLADRFLAWISCRSESSNKSL